MLNRSTNPPPFPGLGKTPCSSVLMPSSCGNMCVRCRPTHIYKYSVLHAESTYHMLRNFFLSPRNFSNERMVGSLVSFGSHVKINFPETLITSLLIRGRRRNVPLANAPSSFSQLLINLGRCEGAMNKCFRNGGRRSFGNLKDFH